MERGKADFRALREKLGITQNDIARYTHKTLKAVKDWEKETAGAIPPADVWEWLDDLDEARTEHIESIVARIQNMVQLHEGKPQAITLTYYRNAKDYAAYGRDSGSRDSWLQVNSTTRALAEALQRAGFDTVYRYPTDPDNAYRRAQRIE